MDKKQNKNFLCIALVYAVIMGFLLGYAVGVKQVPKQLPCEFKTSSGDWGFEKHIVRTMCNVIT